MLSGHTDGHNYADYGYNADDWNITDFSVPGQKTNTLIFFSLKVLQKASWLLKCITYLFVFWDTAINPAKAIPKLSVGKQGLIAFPQEPFPSWAFGHLLPFLKNV